MPHYLATFTTHNSRISDRMVKYNPPGFVKHITPVLFLDNDLELMIELVFDSIERHGLVVSIFNVLPDHVHLLIWCEDFTGLSEAVRKVKGGTSFHFKKQKGWRKEDGPIWSQKFHKLELEETEADYARVYDYVKNNHAKHSERWDGFVFASGKTQATLLEEKWEHLRTTG